MLNSDKGTILERLGVKKKVDAKDLVRKWQSDIRKEERGLERTIRDLQRDSKNAAKQVAIAAKRGDMASARTLAKEIVHTKKAVGRLYVNKANLVAMNAQLTEQLGMVKVAGTLQQSTQVTTLVNGLMRAPELQQTVVQMQKEMMKAGIISEMMDDAMDTDSEVLEEETEAEIDKVLLDVAGATMAELAGAAAPKAQKAAQAAPAETAEEDEALQARLDAVRS